MAVDINATLNNMLESMKAVGQGKAGEKIEDLLGLLIESLNRGFGGLCKVLGVSFIAKSLETGMDSGLKSDGVGNSMIQKSPGIGLQGGTAYQALSALLTFDFKGLLSAAVEPLQSLSADGMHGTHMSYGELGSLTPNVTFAGATVSQGLSIG